MRFFGIALVLSGFVSCTKLKSSDVSASKAETPKQRRTRMDPLLNYLTLPEDFEKDTDVKFLGAKIRDPAVLRTFYKAAAELHGDFDKIFEEIAKDKEKATKILNFNQRLVQASLVVPLTVTNIMFAVGKHIHPLLNYRSGVIDRLAERIKEMEQQNDTVGIVNNFFKHFALPEMQFIEQFCVLMSRAKLLNRPDPKTGFYLDLNGTGLIESQQRIRLDLANFFAKVDLLLTLFLTEPTAAQRSNNLVKRLWSIHWRRWQLQHKDEYPEKNSYLFSPHNYRAEPLHFTFPDWKPGYDPEDAIGKLQAKQALFVKLQEGSGQEMKTVKRKSKSLWIILSTVAGVLVLVCAIAVLFYKRNRPAAPELP